MVALHGIGSRQDLPLPFEMVLAGAVTVLLVTFGLLVRAWHEPRFSHPAGRRLPRLGAFVDHRVSVVLVRAVGLGVFGLAMAAALAGKDLVTNPVFGIVYVLIWVGLVPVSVLSGTTWRRLSPIGTLVGRPEPARPAGTPSPVRFGALALAGFLWLELVAPGRATLPVLRGWIIAWLVWTLGGVLIRGRDWLEQAEPFEVYAAQIARLSPWQRDADGCPMVTSPLRHLVSSAAAPGLTWVVVVLLGGTAFDSFSNTPWWIQTVQASSAPRWLWGSLGLAAMVTLVAATWALAVRGLGATGARPGTLSDDLATSLIPIVTGYALAHYGTLLVLEGQRTLIQLSDPLGLGWNLFGTAELGVNTALFDLATAVSLFQVAMIVGGHVLGVLAAHDRAVALLPRQRQLSGQLPMLAVMVFYTVSGLLLLFA